MNTSPLLCVRCGAQLAEHHPPKRPCERCLLSLGLTEDEPPLPVHSLGASGSPGAPGAPSFPSREELAELHPDLELKEVLGEGGMGMIYRARQRNLDRDIALKVLRTDITAESGFAERFEREARTMARLSHPNIVNVHASGQAGSHYFLILELVEGTNLRQIISRGNPEPQAALAIVSQICDALSYAHGQGVVHRDIKPENILINKEGQVKVVDFGLAKIGRNELEGLRLTRTDQAMGTPQYMAPEQIERPLEVDHRADIYSMGVVFYELLTGELPMGRFGPPSQKVELDVRLDEVVFRTLEKEPERRYQRVGEVKTDMDLIRSETPPALPPQDARAHKASPRSEAHGTSAPPKKRSAVGCGWLALAGLLAFCVIGALLLSFGLARSSIVQGDSPAGVRPSSPVQRGAPPGGPRTPGSQSSQPKPLTEAPSAPND